MRNIGLVSAAVIAMAAMAGAVAASALPVIESHRQITQAELRRNSVREAEEHILQAVLVAESAGLSGEAAQQRITDILQGFVRDGDGRSIGEGNVPNGIAYDAAHRSLINDNQLRRGSDGDLAVSALLAAWRAESQEGPRRGPGRTPLGGLVGGGRGGETLRPRQAPAAGPGSPTAGDAGRNLPGNEAAGQPATDAATTEVQQSQTTDDSDLDDEAGEPD